MQIIMSDRNTPHHPTPAGIDGASVARFITNIVYFVVIYQMIIPIEIDAHVWKVSYQVMGSAVTHAIKGDAGKINPFYPGDRMDAVIFGVAVCRIKRHQIAGIAFNTPRTQAVEIASHYAIFAPAINYHTFVARVSDDAPH